MASLMSLMQAAVQPMAGPSPTPTPTPSGGGVGFTQDQINALTNAILSGGSNGSGSTPKVPTASTRARNATIGEPSVSNPLVFWGTTPKKTSFNGVPAATGQGHGSTTYTGGGDHQLTIEQALNQVFTWDQAKVKEMTDKLNAAGFKITSFDDLKNAWQSVVSRASGMYSVSNGKNKVTPDDVISMSIAENKALGGAGSSSTDTQRTKTINTITAGDGWNALQNTLSKMLGRDPSESEVRDFVGRMNHLAAANPSITVSKTTGIGTPQQNTTSTQTQAGFNANDVIQNAYQDAQANPDYAEHQAATTYFNAALSALGQIGG
jgi:hypothetical protein